MQQSFYFRISNLITVSSICTTKFSFPILSYNNVTTAGRSKPMLNYLSRSQPALRVTNCLDCALAGEPDVQRQTFNVLWCCKTNGSHSVSARPGMLKEMAMHISPLWQESIYQNWNFSFKNQILLLFQSLTNFYPISFNLLEKHFHYINAEIICLQPSDLPMHSGDSRAENRL